MSNLIRFNNVYRDAIQSLTGTNPSAQEIIDAHPNAHLIGCATIQTGGGTFYDLFAKKGRDEWNEVEKIISHFKENGARQTALIRGDCLFGYRPQPFDVVHATVQEYARMGMNVFQNFHGLNDKHVTAGVAEAVRLVRENDGYDITAQGTICIEDNPNVTIDSCLQTAEDLINTGHTGFYLKSASGRLNPDFVYNLTSALIENFGDHSIDVHAHSTFGDAPVCLMAAVEAAVERKHGIGIDVQHPAMSGSTAHPSMSRMYSLGQAHPNKDIAANLPNLNFDAINADNASLRHLRFQYRGSEASYNHKLVESMRAVRAPGGASSTLKTIPGLIENLTIQLEQKTGKTPNWNDIQIAIYETQAEIDEALGLATQVTPYAFNTTLQAAISTIQKLMGNDVWAVMIPETQDYLAGRFGAVPEGVDKALQARALEELGLSSVENYVPSLERKDGELSAAKINLTAAGIVEPTNRQAISAVVLKDGINHVVACANGTNKPQRPPALPEYANNSSVSQNGLSKNWMVTGRNASPQNKTQADIVNALGGIEHLEHISQAALFLKQLDDGLNPFPKGTEWKRQDWHVKLTGTLAEFLNDIPDQLKDSGFRGFTEQFPSPIAREWRLAEVETILRDVIDHRGSGLFDHMLHKVRGREHTHLFEANVSYESLAKEL